MNITNEYFESFKLIGIALPSKTTNKNGQSGIDCGNLWQKFEKGNYMQKISGKLSDEIIAVYYNYEGDYTQPFSYFIGCKTNEDAMVPEGLESLTIEKGNYTKIIAKGKMPDCVAQAWNEIWQTNLHRNYKADFEIYNEKSRDWNSAEVSIFIS